MNIIFFGTPKEVVPVLESLTQHFNVAAVVTTPDQKSGRKQLLTPTPVKAFATEHNISVLTPEKFTQEIIDQLNAMNPDIFIVAAYGKIIPNTILSLPKNGAINIHPSLLPQYRGPTPLQTALVNGDLQTGITFMKMDEEMDHGEILHQLPFTIESTDTFGWLMQSTFAQAAQILPHIIDEYTSGKLKPQPQDDAKATYTKRITKEDGYVDISNPPTTEKLNHMIHAYYPWPSVWTRISLRNKETVIKFLPNNKIQVEGKNPVDLKDFLNGYPEMQEKINKLFGAKK